MKNPKASKLTQQQIISLYKSMQQPNHFPTKETNQMYKHLIKYQLTETEITQAKLKSYMIIFQKSIPQEEAMELMSNLMILKNNIKVIKKYIEQKDSKYRKNLFLLCCFCFIVKDVKKDSKTLKKHPPSKKKMSQKQIFLHLQKYLLKKQNKPIFDKVWNQIKQCIKEKRQLNKFDIDGDGCLDKGQMYSFMYYTMASAGRKQPTRDQFQLIWGKIPKKKEDKITIAELLQFKKSFKSNKMAQKKVAQQIQPDKEAKVIQNVSISQEKTYLKKEQSKKFIRQVILRGQRHFNQEQIERIFKKIDKDGKGMIEMNQLQKLKERYHKTKEKQ